jgi:uncharacterized membrane protein
MKFVRKHTFWFVLAGAVVLSLAIGLALAAQQQLWFDESYSIVLSQRSIGDIIRLTAVDAHPPFYYLLLHFWGGLVGWSEMGVRALSVMFYSAAIGTTLLLLRKLFKERIAILAAPIMLLAPFLLRYSFEVRMYSLIALVVVGSAYALHLAVKTNLGRYWIIYGALVALGVWTLYMSALVFLAQFVYLLATALKRRDNPLKQKWVLAYAGAVLLYAPWIPTAARQLSGGALSGANTTFGIPQLLDVLTFGLLYDGHGQLEVIYWVLIIAVTLAIILTTRAVWQSKKISNPNLAFLACHFLLPLATFAIIATPLLGWRIYMERYLAIFIIFGYASLAVVFAANVHREKKPNYNGYAAIILALAIGAANLAAYGNFNFQRWDKPLNRDIAARISQYCDEAIVVDDLYHYIELSPYMPAQCHFYFYSADEVAMAGGYAPLHGSDRRIADVSELSAQRLVIVTNQDQSSFDIGGVFIETAREDVSYRKLIFFERQ